MKKIAIWFSEPFLENNIFTTALPLNRDNCLSKFRQLRDELKKNNWECATYDIFLNRNEIPDAVIFFQLPIVSIKDILGEWYNKIKLYALLCECEVIAPENWNMEQHKIFNKIFTWRDDLVDDKKYFWMKDSPCAIQNHKLINKNNFLINKLCILLNSNKKSIKHSLELYTARVNIINWFAKNYPDDFDLYGFGWGKYVFRRGKFRLLRRILNHLPFVTYLLGKRYKFYHGNVVDKIVTLKKYKFAICFENAKDIPGYFTEKIFDCFAAGCVPIYWGAPNITDYIPANCFIDFTKFSSYEDMYYFIKNMNSIEYQHYIDNINKFIQSDIVDKFSDQYFAHTITSEIIKDFE